MSTIAENRAVNAIGPLLRGGRRSLTAQDLAQAEGTSVASARTLLANLSRERWRRSGVTYSGGLYSDGAIYGPSHSLERRAWTERLGDGSYRLSEQGWFWHLRHDLGVSTPTEELNALAEALYRKSRGAPSLLVTPPPELA